MHAVREVIAAGTDVTLTYRARAPDGRWVWLQHLAHVARDDAGTPAAMHWVLIDVTDSRRREQAAGLLAAAGRVLSGPGPVSDRLAAAAELAVGLLCDRATVWLRGDDGRYRPVAAAPTAAAPQAPTLRAPGPNPRKQQRARLPVTLLSRPERVTPRRHIGSSVALPLLPVPGSAHGDATSVDGTVSGRNGGRSTLP